MIKLGLVNKVKSIFTDIIAYWKTPATGDYVAYKEYLMLSVGWLGMRFATCFGIGFGVNDAFTAMTLKMTHRDLVILGYVCSVIGYILAPINAHIIDNLRSRDGKYRVFVKLAVPSGILSLFALFYPYERMSYLPMVVSLFLIGQIQGYVQHWYSTGVSNLIYVISPNSEERAKIAMVSSLVHNFAPSVINLLIPVFSDVFVKGDLYNMKTYRLAYPGFIVVGVIMSLSAYYGVRERIVVPKSRATEIGIGEALSAVAKNKLYWIKSTDNWNNFMEDSKNILMNWLFYYGKVGSMTTYGIMDTVTYNSSMWAMLMSPWLIKKLGKKGFKLVKNITQVFIVVGLLLTYKVSLVPIFIFFFLNRFWETSEVIDRAIESDIRDYQQYITGTRIDGSFGVVDTYVGGAIGAVTGLFIPWVYSRNGFNGTDYSVLHVYLNYDDTKPLSAQTLNPNCVLYSLLDKLLIISLIGAVIDIFPWFFYDLKESDQKGVVVVNRLRTAIEDGEEGIRDDLTYCESCEGIFAMKEQLSSAHVELDKSAVKKLSKEERESYKKKQEDYQVALFVNNEIQKYTTDFGKEFLSICQKIVSAGENGFYNYGYEFSQIALDLPKGKTKEEKALRSETVRMTRAIAKSQEMAQKYYNGNVVKFDFAAYEELFDLPEDTKEAIKTKNFEIKRGKKESRIYGKVMKPYLWAKRNVAFARVYSDLDSFLTDYDETRARLDKNIAEQKAKNDALALQRKEQAAIRLAQRKAKKKFK